MPKVNHDILLWARETAGLTREEAVEKLGIRAARGMAAVDRLAALETGGAEPTRPMLVKMAKQYRRPLLTFYMSAPPRKGDRGADFRTLPADEHSVAEDALLDALVRDVQARQSMVRAALEDEDEADPLPFIGSRKVSDGRQAVLAALQALLDVDLDEYRAQPNADAAFDLLRTSAERAGVFVLLKGDLGSYHTAIGTETFRGFAIADDVAPFVIINDRDARPAWSFTLLHELAHLILGQTGVGGARAESEIERFCNDVAGEFLLPEGEIKDLGLHYDMQLDTAVGLIGEFARERNLSRTMVAYKSYRSGVIERGHFDRLTAHFRQEWLRERANRRQGERAQGGGPNYYVVRRHRIGKGLTEVVRRMMGAGALTTSRAARILGVKPHQVQALLDAGVPS